MKVGREGGRKTFLTIEKSLGRGVRAHHAGATVTVCDQETESEQHPWLASNDKRPSLTDFGSVLGAGKCYCRFLSKRKTGFQSGSRP